MDFSYRNDLQRSEILLNNVVDKQFQKLFKPLHILSVIFCLRKFNLHDNFVTPNVKRDVISCALGMVIIYSLLYFTLKYFVEVFHSSLVTTMYFITYLQYAINYTFISFLNTYESQINVDLLLNLHNIWRNLRDSNDDFKVQVICWISAFVLVIVYFMLMSLKLLLDPLWTWARALFVFSTIIFDLELLYILLVSFFLTCKVGTWRRTLNAVVINLKRVTSDESEENELNKMIPIYEMIVESLELMQKCFRWTILFHFIIGFSQAITYIEIVILWSKNKSIDTVVASSHLFGVVMWVLKSFTVEAAVCISCELLYRQFAASQVEVLLHFAHHPTGTLGKFKDNILRLITTRVANLTPWRIFCVDAGLPLRMMALIANYVIVLLQFAFL